MAEFQYTQVPGKLAPFFSKIRTAGVPPKAHKAWLKSLGYTSSNDYSILTVARALGFIDHGGTPTETWKEYRGADSRHVMARAIKKAFGELFAVYPDASKRQDLELTNFFRSKTSSGDQVVSKTRGTFKSLVALANFGVDSQDSGAASPPTPPSTAGTQPHEGKVSIPISNTRQLAPSLHIDVQIHIASDASAEQIEQIFASMGKHLYKNLDE